MTKIIFPFFNPNLKQKVKISKEKRNNQFLLKKAHFRQKYEKQKMNRLNQFWLVLNNRNISLNEINHLFC